MWLQTLLKRLVSGRSSSQANQLQSLPADAAPTSDIAALGRRLGMNRQATQFVAAEAADDLQSARKLLTKFLDRCEQTYGRDHAQTAVVLEKLGMLGTPPSDFAEIEQTWKRCLHIREERLSPEHSDTMRVRHFLGLLYQVTGRHPSSLEMLERNQQILNAYPDVDPSQTDQMLSSMAISYRQTNALPKAEACWRLLIDRIAGRLGGEHPDAVRAQCQLANFLAHTKRYDEAAATLKQSIELLERAKGPNDAALSDVYHLMSAVLAAGDQLNEAEAMHQRAIQFCMKNRTFPPDRPFKRPTA